MGRIRISTAEYHCKQKDKVALKFKKNYCTPGHWIRHLLYNLFRYNLNIVQEGEVH